MHNGEAIERVNTKKILAIHFGENLSWSYHENNVVQSPYAITHYKNRKSLAKTLIISKN